MSKKQQGEMSRYLAEPCPADSGRWGSLWGPPRPPRGGNPNFGTMGGGIGAINRRPGVVHAVHNGAIAGSSERVLHMMVALGAGKTFLHCFVVYAPCGPNTMAARERLLQAVLFDAQAMVGGAPAVVLGDLNTDTDRSPALRSALGNGWVDAAQLQAQHDGAVRPPPTYTTSKAETRIDYALMNRSAALAFAGCSTFNVGSVGSHRCVCVQLSLPAFNQMTLRYSVPRALPPVSKPDAPVPSLEAFEGALADGDVELAWGELSAACEQHLLDRCDVPAAKARPYVGRGLAREPRRVRAVARSCPGKGVTCEAELKYGKAITRLMHYVHARSRLEVSGPFVVPQDLRACWARCIPVLTCEGEPPPPAEPPPAEAARAMLHRVRARSAQHNAAARQSRERQARQGLRERYATDRRSLVSMLRGDTKPSADTLRADGGRLTANLDEMDDVLQQAWGPILRLYSPETPEPSYDDFAKAFGEHVQHRPMQVTDITGEELRTILRERKKKSSACGVDGWRMDELKALPVPLMDAFASFFNLVEKEGRWPEGLLTALVSLIPKSEDPSPTNMRPITVTSCVYRLWACRRLRDIMAWQEEWALPTQHGFRTGHRCDDALMEMATLVEETLLDETKSLVVLALDFAKCFDRVPQGIVLRLAEEMGLDARIHKPLQAMYRGLKRRFKLPLGVGAYFEVTNGILQGCPISVILINALLSVMLRAVPVASESYADDATLHASNEPAVQKAVDVVSRFCDVTGMRLNVKKTVALGILEGKTQQRMQRPYRSTLHIGEGDGKEVFPTVSSTKVLSGRLNTSTKRCDRTNDARLEAQSGLMDALGLSPLPFDERCEIASSSTLGSALSGCQYTPFTKAGLKSLRTRIARGVFGPVNRGTSRSVSAVLTVLAKGHRVDPVLARPYWVLCSLLDSCERLPGVRERMKRICRLYGERGGMLGRGLGPVGIAITDGLPPVGAEYDGFDLGTMKVQGRVLLDMRRAERHHVLRGQLRQSAWTQLAAERPSFDGVQHGVDYVRTNEERRRATASAALRKALTTILAGGVYYATRWGRGAGNGDRRGDSGDGGDGSAASPAASSSSAEGSSGPSSGGEDDRTASADAFDEVTSSSESAPRARGRDCPDCELRVPDTAEHLWWACPAYDNIRSMDCFAALVRADRSRWPSCTRVHGVITVGLDIDATALHRMMGTILAARTGASLARWKSAPVTHAWVLAASTQATAHRFRYNDLPDAPRKWNFGAPMMRALKGWLAALRWTTFEGVSNIELALDFELFTGMDVKHCPKRPKVQRPAGPVSVAERGQRLGAMLAVLCRLCETLKLPSPLPTARLERVKSLHTLGVPRVIGGLQVRPVFAAGAETAAVLEACATRALPVGGLTSQVWGRDVFPQYDSALRAERAQQWEVRRPVLTRSAHPVLVPASQAMTRGRFQVCDKCAKKKCPLCASSSQRTPEQCCQDHHEPGDGVLTQCCGAHHLTRCGGCANASVCCRSGHHRAGDRPDDADDENEAPAPPAGPQPAPAAPRRGLRRKRGETSEESSGSGQGDSPTIDRAAPLRRRAAEDPSVPRTPPARRRRRTQLPTPQLRANTPARRTPPNAQPPAASIRRANRRKREETSEGSSNDGSGREATMTPTRRPPPRRRNRRVPSAVT
ncbi:Retrovirus-related Pol polyprotein from type-2 retrotransposable element R2DM [Diplonema papillatum]|nr:Retrovirus-related Pol polyprotein from type-2 retrotransposable element R2DM [Diplonema papillatum]KAJ9442738.1 Retrovirus-related Pol polyprotein from type-2 retrotransposable element R2DM [Diplonema papillatum]KAJ9447786.1 Retrovirus-related Pol polyprotein from type-2 retrotransposable element R2DM [Diplonema papillatum]KAJ9463963.1 Retrovirus-related Pol polyprotein from type-2 retrotransposable element R2DM [Diplonema papillatum]KAJ9469685.1 Retrovirus-related Pol polyprotein from type